MKLKQLLLIIISPMILFAQNNNPKYDSTLAEKLGADDYGMKSYYFVLLKTGDNKTTDKDFISKCFAGHMENINRMVEAGHLIIAGPFMKNAQSLRGIFIINSESEDEVKKLLENDLAIKEDLLKAEIFQWYGSAALPEYLESSDKIWKKKP